MSNYKLAIHSSVENVFPPEKLLNELKTDSYPVDIEIVPTESLNRFDGVITHSFEKRFLTAGLEWIQSIGSGIDYFPLEELRSRDIILTNATGIHGNSIGETVVGYMLMLSRLLHHFRWSQQNSEWDRPEWDDTFLLSDSTVCVIGLGTVGQGIAKRAHSLGMTVRGVKREVRKFEFIDDIYPSSALSEAISGVDFVVLAVPLTDETKRLIGKKEFKIMEKSGYLINVSRGPVVEEEDLIDALNEGLIAGAALDVFETEPLPNDSSFWDMENVIVTPHSSSHFSGYYKKIAEITNENISRINSDSDLINRVI